MLKKKIIPLIMAAMMIASAIPAPAEAASVGKGASAVPMPAIVGSKAVTPDGAAPASKYSSVSKYITSVKDQSTYDTCTFFAACAAMEASAIKNKVKVGSKAAGKSLNLSESQFAYFFYHRKNDKIGGTKGDKAVAQPENMGGTKWYDAGGNLITNAFHLLSWSGPVKESKAKYKSTMGKTLKSSLAYDDILHVQGFISKPMTDITDVKNLIKKYGAVSVHYCHLDELLNQETGGYYCRQDLEINHAVTIVGWDDNYSKDNFVSKPSFNGAWIAKNQWGKSFGKNGYFYISYEDVPLRNNNAFAFKVENKNNYKYNYQYDGGTFPGEICRDTHGSFTLANTFTAVGGSGEVLKAVGFGAWSEGTKYKIQIYRNSKKGKPLSGKKLLKTAQSGKLTHAGFWTVKLKKGIKLKKGATYTIAIKYCSADGYPVGMTDESDDLIWMRNVTKQKAGQSYYIDGDGIEDLSKAVYYGVTDYKKRKGKTARIKMYTKK